MTEHRRADAELRETQRMLETSRDELLFLAEEQAALRRVATLVARSAPPDELFAAVGREAGMLLGADGARIVRYVGDEIDQLAGWTAPGYGPLPIGRIKRVDPSVTGEVFNTGRPARRDDRLSEEAALSDEIRALGIESAVGAPVFVDGRLWGAMLTWLTHSARLPDTVEARLAGFTELVGTAVSNAANRAELDRVLAEQAALRRVATLVARETPPEEVFAAVAREVGEVLGVDATHLGRYDPDGTVVSVAQWGRHPGVPIDARFPLEGDSVSRRVLRGGRPSRMDGYERASGVIAATIRRIGIRYSIGAPVSVEGRTWGVMIATSKAEDPFPVEGEARLQDFTELLATAISNASAHDRVRVLADEQAALRRVATLVARQMPLEEVFGAIAEEIGRLVGVDSIEMIRYEAQGTAVAVAGWGELAMGLPIGLRVPLGGRNVTSLVFDTGRAARLDTYRESSGPIADRVTAGGVRSAVGTPILAEGRLWGAIVAATTNEQALPVDTESRIGQFTELMATAIANAEARGEAARLADEQAALRRVATLVVQGAPPSAVFDAVTREVAALLDASAVTLARYDGDELVVMAQHGRVTYVRIGDRFPLGGRNVTSIVWRTGRTARVDDYADVTGEIGETARRVGTGSTVGAPVVVVGRTWGVLVAVWGDRGHPSEGTEERMSRFTRLLDTAIANADSRDQLTASRARVVAAGDDARRRVVRDLHDGAQQRLVQTIMRVKLAESALDEDPGTARSRLREARESAERAMAEVRELAHGILPSVLTHGGLRAAVAALVSRLDLPVDVEVSSERLPADIEASAYFILAEALTNVVKHAQATRAGVTATVEDGILTLQVRDDGIGGVDPEGHGLVGIGDRVDALDGRLRIESPDGAGTVLTALIPVPT
jgi:signal transduction histidine kinase